MLKAYKIIKYCSSTTTLPVGFYNFSIREKKFMLTKKNLPLLGASESHVNPIKTIHSEKYKIKQKNIDSKKNIIKETVKPTEKDFDELMRILS